jgi:DNA modification methylase
MGWCVVAASESVHALHSLPLAFCRIAGIGGLQCLHSSSKPDLIRATTHAEDAREYKRMSDIRRQHVVSLFPAELLQEGREGVLSLGFSEMTASPVDSLLPSRSEALNSIDALDMEFERRYEGRFSRDQSLTRGLVSFQANKSRSLYRWYKYKEAFSAELVEFLLMRYANRTGLLLDPFAGSGTALFASSGVGWSAVGIELLPIGQRIMETKLMIERGIGSADMATLSRWISKAPWTKAPPGEPLPEFRITKGAYPQETAESMSRFISAIENENEAVRAILFFALLCILESISFTRKDGQYLRWDHRSGRRQGKKVFDKGNIPSFEQVMAEKLTDIVGDLSPDAPHQQQDLFRKDIPAGEIAIHGGSCLDVLQDLPSSSFDSILTSPPYCNRYDYTRTYALELALLGVNEKELVQLRQNMLSCTVENRAKDLLSINPRWMAAISAAEQQKMLQLVLTYLEDQKVRGMLNNSGIPRMVKGYFYEMACVIFECARVLKPGAPLMMVNDNVRYAGASIPVDIILSEIACDLGFKVEKILVLPNGKGNSSQQMGAHGRDALRKCVYIWRKA